MSKLLSFSYRRLDKNTPSTKVGYSVLVPVLLYNSLIIYLSIVNDWRLVDILMLYWFQSVFLGVSHFIRICLLKQADYRGVYSNGRPLDSSKASWIRLAITSVSTYMVFHAVYMIILVLSFQIDWGSYTSLEYLLALMSVIIGQLFTLTILVLRDRSTKPMLGIISGDLFKRVWIMHIIILLPGVFFYELNIGGIVAFQTVKTLFDISGQNKVR